MEVCAISKTVQCRLSEVQTDSAQIQGHLGVSLPHTLPLSSFCVLRCDKGLQWYTKKFTRWYIVFALVLLTWFECDGQHANTHFLLGIDLLVYCPNFEQMFRCLVGLLCASRETDCLPHLSNIPAYTTNCCPFCLYRRCACVLT